MSRDLAIFDLPLDLAERCRTVRARMDSGEDFPSEQLTKALGLPLEFIIAAIGIAQVLASGRSVLINPTTPEKTN